jgi:lipoprotein-anchoring transpeptidase ErfK/SrfK
MKPVVVALVASVVIAASASAEPLQLQAQLYSQPVPQRPAPAYIAPQSGTPQAVVPAVQQQRVRYAAAPDNDTNLGGGFIEFLFGGSRPVAPPRPSSDMLARATPDVPPQAMIPARPEIDPQYFKQVVPYAGPEKPGTIVIDTPQRFLYLVQENGTAVRYGIGVGKPGFTWAGVKSISAKKEWPDWVPPPEMLQRRPDLPTWMAGGPENPLGARAMYLGSSLYRIHGSNEPWTIGQAVSSGCIRMRNEDVIDLYERVKVGTKVVVI